MKKVLCLLLFFTCSTSLFCMMGDVDSNGITDIVDALWISHYSVGNDPQPFNTEVADVNCSGSIDITDALLVSQYYVGLMVSFPCAPLPVIETHMLKYFLHPDLAGSLSQADLESRLTQYTDEINAIYSRQTGRRFDFDPATGITITADTPHSNSAGPGLPATGYEIWVHAVLTPDPSRGTFGGSMSFDESGAGVVTGMYWDAIHDPQTLPDNSDELEQYWKQITAIVHEMGHVFGAAIGEYYLLITINDTTGIEPVVNVNGYDAACPYWSTHTEYLADPMTLNIYNNFLAGSPTTFAELRETIRFIPLTVNVINKGIRYPTIRVEETLPDLSAVTIRVKDAVTNDPVTDAVVYAWNVNPDQPYTPELIPVEAGTVPGDYASTWPPYPGINTFGSTNTMKLYKVHAPGYESAAKWVSVFDCSEQRLIYGMNHMIIEIMLTPVG